MSDYELLFALICEYEKELACRKNTKLTKTEYSCFYDYPRNKGRIKRLRLEIQALMLRIEGKLEGFGKETWY